MNYIERRLYEVPLSTAAESIYEQICKNEHPCIKLEGSTESIERIQRLFHNILRTKTGLKLVQAITPDQYPKVTIVEAKVSIVEDDSEIINAFSKSRATIFLGMVPTRTFNESDKSEQNVIWMEAICIHELLHFLDLANKCRSAAEGAAQKDYDDYSEQLAILEGVILPDGSRISEHTFCDELDLRKRFDHHSHMIHPSYFKKEKNIDKIIYLMHYYLKINELEAHKIIYDDHKDIIPTERLSDIIYYNMSKSIDKRELFDMPTWKKILLKAYDAKDEIKTWDIITFFILNSSSSPELTSRFLEMIASDATLVKILTHSTEALEIAINSNSTFAADLIMRVKQNWTEKELINILLLAAENKNEKLCSHILEKYHFSQDSLEEICNHFIDSPDHLNIRPRVVTKMDFFGRCSFELRNLKLPDFKGAQFLPALS